MNRTVIAADEARIQTCEAIFALNSVANETERHVVRLRRGLAAARLQVSRREKKEAAVFFTREVI